MGHTAGLTGRALAALVLVLVSAAVGTARAQAPAVRTCGTRNVGAAELEAKEAALRRARAPLVPFPEAFRADVPVVVHVIHDGARGRVSEARVRRQIAKLNEGYGGLDPPEDGGPTLGDAAVTGITFSLEGVRYYDVAGPDVDAAWFSEACTPERDHEIKAAIAVDPARTLNVYTCEPAGGLLGWVTHFPDEAPESSSAHGVVVRHTTLPGDPGGGPYSQGDTLTHEVGHFFGLFHVFQGKACHLASDASAGDAVLDTPPQSTASYGSCAQLSRATVGGPKDTCGGFGQNDASLAPFFGRDSYESYMDYSDDSCMRLFTPGQAERLRSSILVHKPTLCRIQQNGKCESDVDCVVSEWSPWSQCDSDCPPPRNSYGTTSRVPAQAAPRARKPAVGARVPADGWRADGTQTRTRTVVRYASGDGTPCPPTSETRLCTDILTQCNIDPESDTEGEAPGCSALQRAFQVFIQPDSYAEELSWQLASDGELIDGVGFGEVPNGGPSRWTVCIGNRAGTQPRTYVFQLFDSYGDGIYGSFGSGLYELRLDGIMLHREAQFTGSTDSVVFQIVGNEPAIVVQTGREVVCFPAASLVSEQTARGGFRHVPIAAMTPGARLLALKGGTEASFDPEVVVDEVYLISHRELDGRHWYVEMRAGNRTLLASPDHLVWTTLDEGGSSPQLVRADLVVPGVTRLFAMDDALHKLQPTVVKSVTLVQREGAVNVQTLGGSIIVDGVAVSGATAQDPFSPAMMRLVTVPLRVLHRASSDIMELLHLANSTFAVDVAWQLALAWAHSPAAA